MPNIKPWVAKHRKQFRVQYRWNGKKRDIKPISIFDTRNLANKAADNWYKDQLKRATGQTNLDAPIRPLYESWKEDALTGAANKRGEKIKESTIETWENSLKYVLERITKVGQLTHGWVEEYREYLYETYEGWTPHRRLTDLKSFTNYLRYKKEITWDPFEDISISTPSGRPRFYSDEELEALESSATNEGLLALLFLRLGYLCGLRFGEASRLDLRDVALDEDNEGWGLITVWGDESKTDKSGVIPAPPKVMELIVQLFPRSSRGLVFGGRTEHQMLHIWARVLSGAGIRPASHYVKQFKWARVEVTERSEAPYHGLRHTYCKRQLQNGMTLAELMPITRHKSKEVVLKTYAHFESKHISAKAREVYEKIESGTTLVGQIVEQRAAQNEHTSVWHLCGKLPQSSGANMCNHVQPCAEQRCSTSYKTTTIIGK